MSGEQQNTVKSESKKQTLGSLSVILIIALGASVVGEGYASSDSFLGTFDELLGAMSGKLIGASLIGWVLSIIFT
jgi:hypothetical protein